MTLTDDSPAWLPVADDELCDFLDALFGSAVRRQLWATYFDDDDTIIPVMTPIEELPRGDLTRALRPVVRLIATTLDEVAASTVALVWEHPGGSPGASAVRSAAAVCGGLLAEAGVRVRGQFESTGRGMTEIPLPGPR